MYNGTYNIQHIVLKMNIIELIPFFFQFASLHGSRTVYHILLSSHASSFIHKMYKTLVSTCTSRSLPFTVIEMYVTMCWNVCACYDLMMPKQCSFTTA